MHESLRSVRYAWVGFGWFLAVSLTSLILLALIGLQWVDAEPAAEAIWVAIALVLGFLVSGFFVGTRVAAAPVLHGIGMAICSVLVWLALNLVLGEALGETSWGELEVPTLVGLLIVQGVAAVVGTRIGVRWVRTPVEPLAGSQGEE